jgi:hypothetical protein
MAEVPKVPKVLGMKNVFKGIRQHNKENVGSITDNTDNKHHDLGTSARRRNPLFLNNPYSHVSEEERLRNPEYKAAMEDWRNAALMNPELVIRRPTYSLLPKLDVIAMEGGKKRGCKSKKRGCKSKKRSGKKRSGKSKKRN